jgi:hypothetical protein
MIRAINSAQCVGIYHTAKFTFFQFSSFAQPQSKCLLLFFTNSSGHLARGAIKYSRQMVSTSWHFSAKFAPFHYLSDPPPPPYLHHVRHFFLVFLQCFKKEFRHILCRYIRSEKTYQGSMLWPREKIDKNYLVLGILIHFESYDCKLQRQRCKNLQRNE